MLLHRQAMTQGDEEVGPTGEEVRRWNVRTWGLTGEGVRKQKRSPKFFTCGASCLSQDAWEEVEEDQVCQGH